VAIPEAQLLDTPPVELPPLDAKGTGRTGRNLLVPVLMTVGGIVIILIALWGIRSQPALVRTIVGLAGAAVLWRGLQRIGAITLGPTFRLGLWVATAWLAFVVFCAIFAGLLPIEHWTKADVANGLLPPSLSWPQPLGRDTNGYSLLTQCIYGARVSLTIGLIAVGVGVLIGIVIGLLAGWYGKAVDAVVGVGTNTVLAFPPLILLLAIIAVYGNSVKTLALGLAVLSVPTYTRLMRAQTLSIRQRDYVLAARAMGATNRRLMWREVLPNAILPVLSYSFIVIAVTIVAEGSLSFLGYGVPSPRPSWGGMIADGQRKLKTDPHLVFVPATVMFLTVLSLNRVGEWARKSVLGEKSEGR
jgi:peptide/nickel transport system permease protein